MKKEWLVKSFSLGVVILFIGVSSQSVLADYNVKKSTVIVSDGNWLYVGGSGPDNYTRIQDAINDSVDGDTVFVFDDSSPYFENLVVDKSINLMGEDRNNTIIDGNNKSSVVFLDESASGVTIQGFNIIHGDDGLICESDNNIIIGNVISYNNESIYLYCSDNNSIIDNTISMNNKIGLILYYCQNNTIFGNNISNSYYGINLIILSNYNIIRNNIIQNSCEGIRFDTVCMSMYNNILNNSILNSSDVSIGFFQGQENLIENNNLESIVFFACIKNLIQENNFIGNVRHVYSYYSFLNKWDANYWDDWIGLKSNLPIVQKLPKVIICYILLPLYEHNIPFFNFDWHPAKEPYDIEV